MFQGAALKYTKDVLIKYLRGYLANYDNYKSFCDRDFSKVKVWDKDPNDLRDLPAIVITGGSGQMVTSGLQDFAQELRDPQDDTIRYHRFGGMYEFSLRIDIGAKTTKDREVLSDLISLAYRVHIRRFIENDGVLVKDMHYAGETEVLSDSDKTYIATIQFLTWSEWYQDIDYLAIEDIKLDIDNNK